MNIMSSRLLISYKGCKEFTAKNLIRIFNKIVGKGWSIFTMPTPLAK